MKYDHDQPLSWQTNIDQSPKEVFVIGANKDADIQRSQTLRLYAEEFIRRISETPTRLMVIGYSFRDEHINNAILSAAKLKNLSLFVVDPEGYDVFKSDFPAHVTDYSPFSGLQFINQRKELIRIPCVGISTRPLSSTFRDDVLEWDKLFRFFVAPPVEPITP